MRKFLMITATFCAFSVTAHAQQLPPYPRFQIVDTAAGVYMLDTATGQTWQPMVRTLDNGLKFDYWEPTLTFMTIDQKEAFFAKAKVAPSKK